jgi:polysaccharide deacetylase family protein (PEP-CTERM system associated)
VSFVQSFKFHDHGNAAVSGTRIRNALTFDFEDWYHGLEIPLSQCDGFEQRIRSSGERLLELLAATGVRGTFFVLGRVAEQHPGLVKAIAAAGHEIGTHGSDHEFVYRLTEPQFREKMTQCVAGLENLTGIKVLGHRAPFFSITRNSLWALDVLADLGLLYDSSIFPVVNYRYGIPEAPRWPYEVATNRERSLIEFPMSTVSLLGHNIPIAGGAYFRIYPYWISRAALRSINRQSKPFTFYLHPWEIDPGHPRLPLPFRVARTHYHNLKATEQRFRRLVQDFAFAPMKEVLNVG